MERSVKNKGWHVTFAGTGINLALGILYTWSIFKGAIRQSIEKGGAGAFDWDLASLNDPYAVCCIVFAFSMILAGKCQDRFGPRITAFIGFNNGSNLSLFFSFTKDLWGLKNFGINYGIVFTAWGVGGLVMGRMAQMVQASTGSYTYSFLTAASLLIIGVLLTFTLKGKETDDAGIQKDAVLSHGGSK